MKKAKSQSTPKPVAKAKPPSAKALADVLKQRRNLFIDRLSHDLKTPLFGSREVLQLILSGACGQVEPEVEHLVSMLKQTNEDLLQLMQRLLEVYRFDAGCKNIDVSVSDFAEVVKQLVLEIDVLAKANEVTLNFKSTRKSIKLGLDQSLMRQALTHLVQNCLKHMSPQGALHITLTGQKDYVLLTVVADGLGNLRNDFDGIFFLADHRSHGRSYSPMTGLELHLFQQIITAHGGTISTDKRKHGELAITVVLPANTSPASTSPTESSR